MWEVALHAADAREVVVHAGATEFLQQIHHHLAFAEAPHHDREVADVGSVSPQPHQVARYSLQFHRNQPDVLGPLRHLDL